MFERTVTFCRRLIGNEPFAPGGGTLEEDRRTSYRRPTNLQIRYRPAHSPDLALTDAFVHDVSAGGMNISTDREYRPSDLLSVQLPGKMAATFLACVVHVHPDGDGRWNIGCTFPRELTWADLQTFESSDYDLDMDERSRPRFSCDLNAVCQLASQPDADEIEADVQNVSTIGVGLLAWQRLEPGTLLDVELQSPHSEESISILACVVHVCERKEERKWAVGCNFISEIDEDCLRALL